MMQRKQNVIISFYVSENNLQYVRINRMWIIVNTLDKYVRTWYF